MALKYGQDYIGLPSKALLYYQNALLSLTLLLTLMGGRPEAQAPPSGNEPALAPAVSGPLETLPTAQERILAPVPQQFNWLGREAPSNPLLE